MPVLDYALVALRKGDTAALLLLALAGLTLLAFLCLLLAGIQISRLNRRLTRLTGGTQSGNLEDILAGHLETVAQAIRRMETLEQSVGVLQAQIPLCLQRTGLVRYDAFEDVGGAQSFSLALLDAKGDGVVVSSVYGRSEVRVYSKSVSNGRASHALSQEEQQALREAGS